MPDGQVSATEANRNFSKLLRDVEGGARVTITKDSKPVAQLVPFEQGNAAGQQKARERMLSLLREGLPLNFTGGLDRDEVHAR